MKKWVQYIGFFILTGMYSICNAQYIGGNGTGQAAGLYIPSPCLFLSNSNIYYGGISDGSTSNVLISSPCPPILSTNIYVGGSNDGSGSNSFIPTVCPPIINTNIYVGGDADGQANASFIATVCPPLVSTSIYYGGVADGHASNNFIASVCPPLVSTSIYYGGIADGHAGNRFIASVCPPQVSTSIYFGGTSDGWSRRQVTQNLCVLPIELLFFKVNCKESHRLLVWSTASEINNDYFTIERSVNAINWSILAKIQGAGNSSDKLDYSYLDSSAYVGQIYYRLKQTDFDGKYEYFELIHSDCGEEPDKSLIVTPNPSNGKITLLYDGNKAAVTALEIYNALGDKVYSANAFQPHIDLSKRASGVYFIYLRIGADVITKKILIEEFF